MPDESKTNICSFRCLGRLLKTDRTNFQCEGALYKLRLGLTSYAKAVLGKAWLGLVRKGHMPKTLDKNRLTAIGSPSNGAENGIEMQQPYRCEVTIEGVAPILFHAWNVESVESKANAKKGSKEKKTDDLESYINRNDKGEICIPGEYLRGSIVNAAKFMQDPRSPRKSAMDLFKAAVVSLTPLASLGAKDWDYLDRRRVVIQRNAITRTRPAMREGWSAKFIIMVGLPEYISSDLLNHTIQNAGRLIGLGDFRPSFGRFLVTAFKVLED